MTGNINNKSSNNSLEDKSTDEEERRSLPRASLNKLIKETVPDYRVSNEVKELLLNCCSEFIHILSTEANEITKSQMKKTINTEHVVLALDTLGFAEFQESVTEVAKVCKVKKRKQSTRLENLGIPEEELYRQQQALFAKARAEQAAETNNEWEAVQIASCKKHKLSKDKDNSGEEYDD